MSDLDASLQCPVCRTSGVVSALEAGASLEGCSCRRCGGTLLPTTGSERLLHEELALDRAALVDLAESFGGRRFSCPACRARMRSLILRGVDVDLCFGCGSLWLDHGELEQLSGHRHRGLQKTKQEQQTLAPSAAPSAVVHRPDANVRLDARHPVRRALGMVLRAAGVGVGVSVAVGHATPALAPLALLAFVGGMWLRRRSIVDVFPRARRLLRSRRWMPADARDPDAERLDEKTWVVVRPWGGKHVAASSFVDSCGRTIAPLAIGRPKRVLRDAKAIAKKLGASVVVDARLEKKQQQEPARVPKLAGEQPFDVRLHPGPSTTWEFHAADVHDHQLVFTLKNAVPARGDEEAGAERLALCFCFSSAVSDATLRFHDDGDGHTVVVDASGEAWGSIERRARAGVDWLAFSLAGRALRVHCLAPPLSVRVPLVDDAGAVCGHLRWHDGWLDVDIAEGAAEEVRFCCVLLAAHAALDAGHLLRR